jgi:hypothetical protein
MDYIDVEPLPDEIVNIATLIVDTGDMQMPMGIAGFSFDLFGLSRREPTGGQQSVRYDEDTVTQDLEATSKAPATEAPAHRDHEHVFWRMFPVL